MGQIKPPETVVNIEQNQKLNQNLSFDQIQSQVTDLNLESGKEEELAEIVQEFEDEVKEEEPDNSRLRSLYESAAQLSHDTAIQLVVLATQRGVKLATG